jgi:hypothetical protein
VNGDTFDDLIIGAYGADPNGGNSGESYVVFGGSVPCPAGNVLFVDADATASTNTGTTWADAFTNLQDALARAESGVCPSVTEIWVADGTYYPDKVGLSDTNDRSATFALVDGVSIYGGFEGFGGAEETALNQRDIAANVTILSGDLKQNDDSGGDNSENAFHVVTSDSSVTDALLNGVTITGGNANGSSFPANSGGGILNDGGSPTLTNVIITGNQAGNGGGISNGSGEVKVMNSTISGNTASGGGGISNNDGGTVEVMNSTISGNTAISGGGIANNGGILTVSSSTLSGNSATYGGGISNSISGALTVTNSTLSGNSASNSGGGIRNSGTVTLANTIVANSTSGGDYSGNAPTTLGVNTIESGVSASASVLTDDPALGPLADNGGPTLTHLPQSGSPAIDGGDDSVATDQNDDPLTTDQRGFARISGTVDIGAVEIQYTTYEITVDPVSIDEDDSGTTEAIATVTRSGATSVASSVDVALSGSATAGNDYSFALDAASGVTFDGTTLSFAAGETTATFTIAVQGDQVDEGTSETAILTLENPTGLDAGVIEGTNPAELTITDDDTAGVSVSKSALTVSESGTTDSYTVALDSQPTQPVTITATSLDTGEATVSPATLNFTTGNWDTAQVVTVTGEDDTDIDGTQTVTITHTVSSADSAYDGASIGSVDATVTDNDSDEPTDTTPPDAPEITSPALTDSPTPTISGTTEAGVTITLTIDLGGGASVTYTTTADGDGTWSIDLANDTPTDGDLPEGGLSDGSYPVTVTATNETGSASTQYTLTVQTSTPAAGTTLYLPLIAR